MPDKQALSDCARKAANWLVSNQVQYTHGQGWSDGNCGNFTWTVNLHPGEKLLAPEWAASFSLMACASAYKVFGDEKYLSAVKNAAVYLKSLQLFSPFLKKHFGAIREYTPATSWCYVRDAVSAAWCYIALYRLFNEQEYLERARLFMEWLCREGMDRDGFPYWGVELDKNGFNFFAPKMNPHLQGTFHGGSLNFFYQLYQATGNKDYIGNRFVNLADLVVERIQQPDGSFATYDTRAGAPVARDPQGGLHAANDDFNTIGLLCAHRITNDKRYMEAVEKFIEYAVPLFSRDAGFGPQRASLPVVANLLMEYEKYQNKQGYFSTLIEQIFELLLKVQCQSDNKDLNGAFIEVAGKDFVCARTTQYAVIAILKYLGENDRYLGLSDLKANSPS
jgi:uncharacterized protein YyaL (SSP411 family)